MLNNFYSYVLVIFCIGIAVFVAVLCYDEKFRNNVSNLVFDEVEEEYQVVKTKNYSGLYSPYRLYEEDFPNLNIYELCEENNKTVIRKECLDAEAFMGSIIIKSKLTDGEIFDGKLIDEIAAVSEFTF